MKYISIIFAICALITGLKAAYHWHEASKVTIDPGWTPDNPEPTDEELKQLAWNVAIIKAATKSANLNKVAAQWTAIAVILGAISSVAGSLNSN